MKEEGYDVNDADIIISAIVIRQHEKLITLDIDFEFIKRCLNSMTPDTPDEIDASIVEEIFKLKVDKENFKEKLKEIEKIAMRTGISKEDTLKVLMELRE